MRTFRLQPTATLRTLVPLAAMLALIAFARPADAAVVPAVVDDTLTITGDGADDRLVLRLAASEARTLEVDAGANGSADFAFERAAFSRIIVRTGDGADEVRISDANGTFTDTETTTIETGAGADVVLGGSGAETIATGDDRDLVLPGLGNDIVFAGAGDDTAVAGAGDGADAIEGQSGADTLRVGASGATDRLAVQAVGGRVRIGTPASRAPGLDLAGVERAELSAGGGADAIEVGDLAGTDLKRVDADLGLADGAPDTVSAAGTAGPDTIDLTVSGDTAVVTRGPLELRVENAQPAHDRLAVDGSAGVDKITSSPALGTLIGLSLAGGADLDIIHGSNAADVLDGGPGNDAIFGHQGADTISLGEGDDSAIWDAGDGDDTIDGGDAGFDRFRFSGSAADETVDLAPDGSGVRMFHSVSGDLDLAEFEFFDLLPRAGADTVAVHDLSATGATHLNVDLVSFSGSGVADERQDNLILDGSAGADNVTTFSNSTGTDVSGFPLDTFVQRADANDRLTLRGLAGDDQLDTRALSPLRAVLQGGDGDDTLAGSPQADLVSGGRGADFAFMGAGDDTFTWGQADESDIVEGQAGFDLLHMTGSGANETYDVSSAGSRVRVVRTITSSLMMDLSGIDRLDVRTLAGIDTATVNDLSGTELRRVAFDLAGPFDPAKPDTRRDSVTVLGTQGGDVVNIVAPEQEVFVLGLHASVSVKTPDPKLDALHVDLLGGTDFAGIVPRVRDLVDLTLAPL